MLGKSQHRNTQVKDSFAELADGIDGVRHSLSLSMMRKNSEDNDQACIKARLHELGATWATAFVLSWASKAAAMLLKRRRGREAFAKQGPQTAYSGCAG